MTRRSSAPISATIAFGFEHLAVDDLPAAEGQELRGQRGRALRGLEDLLDRAMSLRVLGSSSASAKSE